MELRATGVAGVMQSRGHPVHTTPEDTSVRRPLFQRILVRRFLLRRPGAWGSLYLSVGLVHVFLGLVITVYRYWWGTGLIAVGALELWVADQLLRGRRVPAAASVTTRPDNAK
jgi:hypothetical protein